MGQVLIQLVIDIQELVIKSEFLCQVFFKLLRVITTEFYLSQLIEAVRKSFIVLFDVIVFDGQQFLRYF